MLNVIFAVYSMVPNKALDLVDEDDDDLKSSPTSDKHLEMQPQTPRTLPPFTPRTQAFHTLDRQLPLRSQYS